MACEYCEEEKPIIDEHSVMVKISSFYEELYATYYDQSWDCKKATINYCPMCGRKLGDTNE